VKCDINYCKNCSEGGHKCNSCKDWICSKCKEDGKDLECVCFLLEQGKLMFLLGFHERVGVDSSVTLSLFRHSIYEPALLVCIFEFIQLTWGNFSFLTKF